MDLIRYSLTSQREQIHVGAWPGISALTHDPNSSGFNDVPASAARNHAWSAQTLVVNVQSCIDETVISKLGFKVMKKRCVFGADGARLSRQTAN